MPRAKSGIDRKKIERLTEEYGGEWALNHARRLIRLVELIGEGLEYNRDAIWIAAHMHDWGAYGPVERPNHSRESLRLARDFLRSQGCPEEWMQPVLEAIEFHHGGAADRCIEAILLSDADALEGIGAVGVLREFAMITCDPHDQLGIPTGIGLRGAHARARIRQENNFRMLKLPKSRQVGRQRIKEMDRLLTAFEQETFGLY